MARIPDLSRERSGRLRTAESVVRATRERLPPVLREQSAVVLIRYDTEPDEELLASGLEPDTLGLFEGCTFAEQLSSEDALPPRIILFLDVLWEECQGDRALFCEEVRRTYLHELGHFLGLNEDELLERGLE